MNISFTFIFKLKDKKGSFEIIYNHKVNVWFHFYKIFGSEVYTNKKKYVVVQVAGWSRLEVSTIIGQEIYLLIIQCCWIIFSGV